MFTTPFVLNQDEAEPARSSQSSYELGTSTSPDWFITFEQFLANVLNEGPIVKFFDQVLSLKIDEFIGELHA